MNTSLMNAFANEGGNINAKIIMYRVANMSMYNRR